MRFIWIIMALWSTAVLAIPCDCSVQVYSPMTGSHRWPPNILKVYQLEEYGTYSLANQLDCRKNCLKEYLDDMPTDRLRALLLGYTQELINQGQLGYNCTGLTTLKYPVRVKAQLGRLPLGNVEDRMEVINHEEICF